MLVQLSPWSVAAPSSEASSTSRRRFRRRRREGERAGESDDDRRHHGYGCDGYGDGGIVVASFVVGRRSGEGSGKGRGGKRRSKKNTKATKEKVEAEPLLTVTSSHRIDVLGVAPRRRGRERGKDKDFGDSDDDTNVGWATSEGEGDESLAERSDLSVASRPGPRSSFLPAPPVAAAESTSPAPASPPLSAVPARFDPNCEVLYALRDGNSTLSAYDVGKKGRESSAAVADDDDADGDAGEEGSKREIRLQSPATSLCLLSDGHGEGTEAGGATGWGGACGSLVDGTVYVALPPPSFEGSEGKMRVAYFDAPSPSAAAADARASKRKRRGRGTRPKKRGGGREATETEEEEEEERVLHTSVERYGPHLQSPGGNDGREGSDGVDGNLILPSPASTTAKRKRKSRSPGSASTSLDHRGDASLTTTMELTIVQIVSVATRSAAKETSAVDEGGGHDDRGGKAAKAGVCAAAAAKGRRRECSRLELRRHRIVFRLPSSSHPSPPDGDGKGAALPTLEAERHDVRTIPLGIHCSDSGGLDLESVSISRLDGRALVVAYRPLAFAPPSSYDDDERPVADARPYHCVPIDVDTGKPLRPPFLLPSGTDRFGGAIAPSLITVGSRSSSSSSSDRATTTSGGTVSLCDVYLGSVVSSVPMPQQFAEGEDWTMAVSDVDARAVAIVSCHRRRHIRAADAEGEATGGGVSIGGNVVAVARVVFGNEADDDDDDGMPRRNAEQAPRSIKEGGSYRLADALASSIVASSSAVNRPPVIPRTTGETTFALRDCARPRPAETRRRRMKDVPSRGRRPRDGADADAETNATPRSTAANRTSSSPRDRGGVDDDGGPIERALRRLRDFRDRAFVAVDAARGDVDATDDGGRKEEEGAPSSSYRRSFREEYEAALAELAIPSSSSSSHPRPSSSSSSPSSLSAPKKVEPADAAGNDDGRDSERSSSPTTSASSSSPPSAAVGEDNPQDAYPSGRKKNKRDASSSSAVVVVAPSSTRKNVKQGNDRKVNGITAVVEKKGGKDRDDASSIDAKKRGEEERRRPDAAVVVDAVGGTKRDGFAVVEEKRREEEVRATTTTNASVEAPATTKKDKGEGGPEARSDPHATKAATMPAVDAPPRRFVDGAAEVCVSLLLLRPFPEGHPDAREKENAKPRGTGRGKSETATTTTTTTTTTRRGVDERRDASIVLGELVRTGTVSARRTLDVDAGGGADRDNGGGMGFLSILKAMGRGTTTPRPVNEDDDDDANVGDAANPFRFAKDVIDHCHDASERTMASAVRYVLRHATPDEIARDFEVERKKAVVEAKEGSSRGGFAASASRIADAASLARRYRAARSRAEELRRRKGRRSSSSSSSAPAAKERKKATRDDVGDEEETDEAERELSFLTYRLLREGAKDVVRRVVARTSRSPCNGALLRSAIDDALTTDLEAAALMNALATVLRESIATTMTTTTAEATTARGAELWIAALADARLDRLRTAGTLLDRTTTTMMPKRRRGRPVDDAETTTTSGGATTTTTMTTKRKRRPNVGPVGRVRRVVTDAITQTEALVGLRDAIGAIDAAVEEEEEAQQGRKRWRRYDANRPIPPYSIERLQF